MAKKLLVLGTLALVMALALAPAAFAVADGYGGDTSTVPGSGPTGTTVTTTGEAEPGEHLDFVFCSQSIPVGSVDADPEMGTFQFVWRVPPTADSGECTLRGSGDQGTIITQTFTVTTTQTLAYTGAQIGFWVLAGLGLMTLGAGLILKRKTQIA